MIAQPINIPLTRPSILHNPKYCAILLSVEVQLHNEDFGQGRVLQTNSHATPSVLRFISVLSGFLCFLQLCNNSVLIYF